MMRRQPLFVLLLAGCATGGSGAASRDAPRGDEYVAGTDTLRIVAYNIHHGAGMDEVIDLDRIARLIVSLQPDLVALQEVDSVVERTRNVDQASVLSDLTELTAHFGAFMPYQGGHYGMAVLSRWPIVSVTNHRLPDGEEPRAALAVRVRSPKTGRELDFVGIHLYRSEAERLAQAERLMEVYRREPRPSILAGDFNSQPGSVVLDSLKTMWYFVEKGSDRFTFPSTGPEREIDFVAYRPVSAFVVGRQRVLDEPVISDHRPLFVELVWR